jgi:hypothetical protein
VRDSNSTYPLPTFIPLEPDNEPPDEPPEIPPDASPDDPPEDPPEVIIAQRKSSPALSAWISPYPFPFMLNKQVKELALSTSPVTLPETP